MNELELAIREWLAALRQAGLADQTIEKYGEHGRNLEVWLRGRGIIAPGRITKEDLRWWGVSLYDRNWSPATVRLAVFAVKSFLRWCWEEDIFNESLHHTLRVPKIKARIQRTLTIDEIGQLLMFCDDSAEGWRNAAIVSLMVDSGLRASEVCRLKRVDLQLQMRLGQGFVNVVLVQIKGGAVLPAYFGQATVGRLDSWLQVRQARQNVDNVFVSLGGHRPGTGLTRHGLKQILGKLGKRAGIPRVGPHALRRAFAVIAHQAGGSSRQIMEWGRWSSIAMVERYTMAYKAGPDYPANSPMDYVKARNCGFRVL